MAESGARLGLIIPRVNTVLEPDIYRRLPLGVTLHSTRFVGWTERKLPPEAVPPVVVNVAKECSALFKNAVDVVAFGDSSGSFMEGAGWDTSLISLMEKECGVPCTTASTAMIRSLKRMNIERVALSTPYSERGCLLLKAFIEGNGIRVPIIHSITPAPSGAELTRLPAIHAYEHTKRTPTNGIDGIFVPSTDWRAFDVLPLLERELKIPVISVNQALFYDLMELAKVRRPMTGQGSLLEQPY